MWKLCVPTFWRILLPPTSEWLIWISWMLKWLGKQGVSLLYGTLEELWPTISPKFSPLWLVRISPNLPYNRRIPYTPPPPTKCLSKLFRSIALKKDLVISAEKSKHTSTTQGTNWKAYHNPYSCVFLHFPLIVFFSHHFYSTPLSLRRILQYRTG